jgi:hypothetical protein
MLNAEKEHGIQILNSSGDFSRNPTFCQGVYATR